MLLGRKKYKELSDEVLMTYVQKGEKQAFDEIYNRYSSKLLYYLYRMLNRDEEKAQDILHDLFIKVVDRPELFDTSKKFSTWIYTIATNLCKNEYRSQNVRSIVTKVDDPEVFGGESERSSSSVDYAIFMQRLEEELSTLSEQHREVFMLRFQGDMSLKEISDVIGCPEGTVKSRLFYTLKKLSTNMSEFKELLKN
jgi:RNA polymerase sigma-70 factor (ECF subfamily)